MACIVLTFPTIHDALAAERSAIRGELVSIGAEGAVKIELLPLPPSIKSDCGFGLYIDTIRDEAALLAQLRGAELRYEAAYSIRGPEASGPHPKERIYERIDEAR